MGYISKTLVHGNCKNVLLDGERHSAMLTVKGNAFLHKGSSCNIRYLFNPTIKDIMAETWNVVHFDIHYIIALKHFFFLRQRKCYIYWRLSGNTENGAGGYILYSQNIIIPLLPFFQWIELCRVKSINQELRVVETYTNGAEAICSHSFSVGTCPFCSKCGPQTSSIKLHLGAY